MEAEFVRLLFTVLIGGAGFILTVVMAALAAYKFIQKEIEKKTAKHFHHEHVLDKQSGMTVRDRLIECRRGCPALNPQPVGGSDERGKYSHVGLR
jgi:hypothetical protein